MQCPFCRADNDRVVDSRASQDGFAIRRRRECVNCRRRFTTYERVEEMAMKLIKKDGVRVPFEREKIRQGLTKACWKRPVSDEQIEAVVTAVENDIYANFDSEVESRFVGEAVMQHLRQLDQVAFVRFASVYREFKDVRDFVDELEPILAESPQSALVRGQGLLGGVPFAAKNPGGPDRGHTPSNKHDLPTGTATGEIIRRGGRRDG